MSGQMPGMAGRDPGHVAEAAGGQPQQGAVLLGAVGGRVHEGGRHQVRHVGHHGDQAVVVGRREDEHVGAQAHDDALQSVERLEVGGRRRREHPDRALEEVGVGAVQARSARSPAIGWPADEARVVGLLHDGRLDAAHVGDHDVGRRRSSSRRPTGHPATEVAGTATKTTSASRSSPAASMTSSLERRARAGPRRRRARTRASPVAAARGRWTRRSARSRRRAPGGAPRPQSGRSSRSPWAPWR